MKNDLIESQKPADRMNITSSTHIFYYRPYFNETAVSSIPTPTPWGS